MMPLFMLFLSLLFWHALADYPLQGFLSTAKCKGGVPGFPWQMALVTHAYIHAFGVLIITGNLWGGFIELVAHTIIDYAKCEGWLGAAVISPFPSGTLAHDATYHSNKPIWIDQALHVLTKVVILAVLRVRFV
jgi:hypothetical protein